MGMSRFSTLNFSSLVELHLVALGDTDVSQILDFAEESNQKALILHSDMAIEDLETHPIFDHSFMTRVVSLRLDFVDEISDSLFSDFEGIIGPFPHIKSCTIEAPPQALSVIDLREIEKLEFCCQGSQGEFKMDLIPDQLDELSLSRLILDPRILSLQHGRRNMANLNTLKLSYTAIDGYLRQYLNLPNLKNLYMEGIWFSKSLLAEEGQPAPVDPLSDERFFQGMPRLERLSLSSLSTNNPFGASLQNCQLLRELLVHYCSIDDFVSSFADSLTNSAKFPSLTNLRIDSSWPNECTTSFLEFATTCASRRQRLAISGNERAYK
ncbi:hypothetical protein CPB86DRAFT_794771 [Serendipita vermifera]|nr:hypothetical protein CPB86DRAFT_794771 [Serendipita vermifera]